MIEKDLDKVLNYMKQYVENKYEHDSEPMLNYKDLQLVLKEIERLNKELEYSDFCNKQLRDTIANLEYKTKRLEEDLKELKGSDKE